MIQMQTVLEVTDNSGAKKIACIHPRGGGVGRIAHLGDVITASVKEATPESTIKKGSVVKAVIAEALCLEFEEFFELTILTEDEDSSFHVADSTRTGGDLVQAINSLRRSRTPFTFQDAYEHSSFENNPEYLVVFDTSDGSNDEVGEGRMGVRLRVL